MIGKTLGMVVLLHHLTRYSMGKPSFGGVIIETLSTKVIPIASNKTKVLRKMVLR